MQNVPEIHFVENGYPSLRFPNMVKVNIHEHWTRVTRFNPLWVSASTQSTFLEFFWCSRFSEFDSNIFFYKITKIVCALWLAESSVCMRVCKHGCGVNLFGFSRANHASTKFEKVFEFKTRQVYFIYPFLRRLKHGKSLQRSWVNFSSLKLTF